jgi:hypothetical protein
VARFKGYSESTRLRYSTFRETFRHETIPRVLSALSLTTGNLIFVLSFKSNGLSKRPRHVLKKLSASS